jgi:hypothetical protein
MHGLGNISIKEKQVKITENIIYSTSTKKKDFRVVLVIDEYTLHASNAIKFSFISSVTYCLFSRGKLGGYYFASAILQIAYRIFFGDALQEPLQRPLCVVSIYF